MPRIVTAAGSNRLNPRIGSDSLLYPAMILLDHVIQIICRIAPYTARYRSNLFQFGDRPMLGGVALQGDHPWDAMLPRRPGKEPLGGCDIPPSAQEIIDGAALFVVRSPATKRFT